MLQNTGGHGLLQNRESPERKIRMTQKQQQQQQQQQHHSDCGRRPRVTLHPRATLSKRLYSTISTWGLWQRSLPPARLFRNNVLSLLPRLEPHMRVVTMRGLLRYHSWANQTTALFSPKLKQFVSQNNKISRDTGDTSKVYTRYRYTLLPCSTREIDSTHTLSTNFRAGLLSTT